MNKVGVRVEQQAVLRLLCVCIIMAGGIPAPQDLAILGLYNLAA
ncbi:MAG: hypothetical protein ACKPER_18910 [Dolichospermum sp.]